MLEIDSWDATTPEHAAAIAAGTLTVRDVRPPRVDEGQDPGRTALGHEVPVWARPGAAVLAVRNGGLERARVRSVGEGVLVLEWPDGARTTIAWAHAQPAPAVAR